MKQGAGMPAVVAVLMARLEVEDLAIHEPSLEEVVAGLYSGEKL